MPAPAHTTGSSPLPSPTLPPPHSFHAPYPCPASQTLAAYTAPSAVPSDQHPAPIHPSPRRQWYTEPPARKPPSPSMNSSCSQPPSADTSRNLQKQPRSGHHGRSHRAHDSSAATGASKFFQGAGKTAAGERLYGCVS